MCDPAWGEGLAKVAIRGGEAAPNFLLLLRPGEGAAQQRGVGVRNQASWSQPCSMA